MVFTLQARWILLFSFVGTTFLIKSSLSRMIHSHVHHGNYNPSCKAKTNMQEDSDGPMTRARAKQLQRALTSQIGMIEAASELKISNYFEIGSRMFICLQLELGDEKSP